MKVLILNDCGAGKTGAFDLLSGICDGIAAPHEIEWVDIHGLVLRPCVGCLKCLPCGECIQPEDDAHRVGRMLYGADAVVIGLSASPNTISSHFKTLLDRCMATVAFQNRHGKVCPWRKGRVAVVATMGTADRFIVDPGDGTVDIPVSLMQVLEAGGFNVLDTMTDGWEGPQCAGLLPREQARALGCALSCMLSASQAEAL
jgi:hypothetical protein